MTESITPNVTSVFLYSPQHQRMRDEGRLPRLSYAADDDTKNAYTKEIIVTQPDAEAEIANYQKQFPDSRIVGYGTKDTQKLTSAPPTVALLVPH